MNLLQRLRIKPEGFSVAAAEHVTHCITNTTQGHSAASEKMLVATGLRHIRVNKTGSGFCLWDCRQYTVPSGA